MMSFICQMASLVLRDSLKMEKGSSHVSLRASLSDIGQAE